MPHLYDEIARRWTAIWNETDRESRLKQATAIWADDASHYAPGFIGHGLDQINDRVDAAHNRFVKQAGFNIRAIDVAGYGDVLRVLWEIGSPEGGPVVARGSEVIVLAEDGKILRDYQFNDPQ
ncbi:nuclear transport factor 2 family protein [Neorhizobium sp. T786]|uniref:nuclear transport factor 2 family protein n=1 Tax=Pseudorhizobium xiangyangii TaxID=2883104 RepID=UPI001CFF5C0A|nr:nuclear transport factor 2 family protein [Neorhizobium xiangyangii]MCB5205498.1 nuclear transport factor 2 family protein [Neorhizobium xiangyangii]